MEKEDKLQKICDALKKETLQPAEQKAKEIIENAKIEAQNILKEASYEKEKVLKEKDKETEQKEKIALSALKVACQKVVDELKNRVENEVFNKNLKELVNEKSSKKDGILEIMRSISKIIEKEGIESDFSILIPKENIEIVKKEVHKKIAEKLIDGIFIGGVKIKLLDKNMIIDISSDVLYEMLKRYLTKDFRETFFK